MSNSDQNKQTVTRPLKGLAKIVSLHENHNQWLKRLEETAKDAMVCAIVAESGPESEPDSLLGRLISIHNAMFQWQQVITVARPGGKYVGWPSGTIENAGVIRSGVLAYLPETEIRSVAIELRLLAGAGQAGSLFQNAIEKFKLELSNCQTWESLHAAFRLCTDDLWTIWKALKLSSKAKVEMDVVLRSQDRSRTWTASELKEIPLKPMSTSTFGGIVAEAVRDYKLKATDRGDSGREFDATELELLIKVVAKRKSKLAKDAAKFWADKIAIASNPNQIAQSHL